TNLISDVRQVGAGADGTHDCALDGLMGPAKKITELHPSKRYAVHARRTRCLGPSAHSMLEQQRPKSVDLVVDAARAERIPIGTGIDGKHGLAEPLLGFGSHSRKRKIGAHLPDELDARIVHFAHGTAQP